jgi:hypothetical protein
MILPENDRKELAEFCGLCWHEKGFIRNGSNNYTGPSTNCKHCGIYMLADKNKNPTFDNANDVQMLVDQLYSKAELQNFEWWMTLKFGAASKPS